MIGGAEIGLSLMVPKGKPAVLINSLRYQGPDPDLVLIKRRPAELGAQYQGILTPGQLRELQEGLERLHVRLSSNHGRLQIDISQEHRTSSRASIRTCWRAPKTPGTSSARTSPTARSRR